MMHTEYVDLLGIVAVWGKRFGQVKVEHVELKTCYEASYVHHSINHTLYQASLDERGHSFICLIER